LLNTKNAIALFGGSFDPVHLGHVKMLEYVLDHFDFKRIDIVPTQVSPFKEENLFTGAQRLEFLNEVFKYPKVEINTLELDRKGPSYTSLTVKEYKNKYPDTELFMLIGSDNIKGLKAWNDFNYLCQNLTFIIFSRPQYPLDNLGDSYLKGIKYHLVQDFDFLVSSSQIKDQLKSKKVSDIKASRLFDGLIPVSIQGLLLEYHSK
jgi:nicotinate-nucleotide adenylyltransferase